VGARHGACAWGSYAWPDASEGSFMRSFTSIHGSATGRRQAELEQYAWRNRRALTDSEAVLWEALRARKLGVQFRRQVPLCGRFIADFYAAAAQLVVEVDGGSHRGRETLMLGGIVCWLARG
jgi:hypothetical protein